MFFDLCRRRLPTAIPLPDRSISASDAARILAATRTERERAKVRAMCRELCAIAGKPVPAALRD